MPSKGVYYPTGSITLDENGEVGVYPMTAKDEIVMKTPDALLTGKSTVEVIQSCIPAIKDAWQVPSIDVDTILIAIILLKIIFLQFFSLAEHMLIIMNLQIQLKKYYIIYLRKEQN